MTDIVFRQIGVIHSPFTEPEGMPIQPVGARGVEGFIDVEPDLAPGLKDLDGFSHIALIYHFHRQTGYSLELVPFLDDRPRGVFSTRAPRRPNGIGLSVVRLDRVDGARLHVLDLDILDGTPLLDIKPFVPEFEPDSEIRTGWLEESSRRASQAKSDGRFEL